MRKERQQWQVKRGRERRRANEEKQQETPQGISLQSC